ncbi:ABC transporter substrate-binding protein [Halobacillus aidingensis]|uniref:Iron complex transport system substrate-binding protein n=1 Tax=Halobacillus aidingensis TaxID=240303 RepID=A0A1H0NB16_HALAD|nr:iron-siderophore ABC transporter substrate-binding protein [Halobacillus aidingensis]SDO89944.1 iron complex transport system substrate-binding protein [Halobacillus aidingensis]
MKIWQILSLLLLVLFLAACGEEGSSDETASSESSTSEETRTVESSTGEVDIEGTPERVVVLEWSYVEHMLPLHIQPVGVADKEGYNKWVNVGEPLADEVQDVGTRSEPNFEAISRLDPDLIIGAKYRHEGFEDQLNEIAPTIMFAPYSEEGASDQYQHLKNEFKKMGELFKKEKEAEKYLTQMEQRISALGKEIGDGSKVEAVVTQAFTSQNTPTMRLFTDNSVVAGVLNQMGINNAVETEQPEIFGFVNSDVESLQNYQDSHFFYLVQDDDPIFDNLADNPAWTNLNFVEENHTYKLPGDMGTFAGPLSAERLAEEIAENLE